MTSDLVLYVYRCGACGFGGELRLPGDSHDGEDATCSKCGAPVRLEWDGGVTLHADMPQQQKGNIELTKGMRVRAEWLEAQPVGAVSLAGVQTKVGASLKAVEGVVTHIRGNHPTAPTSIGVWLKTDAGEEVVTDARNIVAVL